MQTDNDNKEKKKYPFLWAAVYGVLLTGYAVFALLDAFVIPDDLVYVGDNGGVSAEAETIEYSMEPGTYADAEETSAEYTTAAEESTSETETAESETEYEAETNAAENKDTYKENGGTALEELFSNKSSAAEETVIDENSANEADAAPVITETSYESGDISINITTYRQYDTQIYAADVVIKNASSLQTALANGTFGRNVKQKTHDIAEECGAVFAVNGDYYGFRDSGYVMRNGYVYRDTVRNDDDNEDLVIYSGGSFEVIDEDDVTVDELVQKGAVQIFSFGPGLISGGEITVNADTEVDRSKKSNPRTAIGEIEPLHYLFVVSDGRTDESAGLTLLELAQFMKEQGCKTAYNLDGGGSSTMWFNGSIINNTTGGGGNKERSVSDIVCIIE